jgi:hypothetical protein
MGRTLLVTGLLMTVLGLAACSGKSGAAGPTAADANGAPSTASGPASTSTSAPLYPDWAQAVVAPYPNAAVGILVNTRMYQFQSTDDPATVLAWYKQRVSGNWAKDATSDVWSVTSGSVQISVSRNDVTSTPDAAKIKTMVMISQRS